MKNFMLLLAMSLPIAGHAAAGDGLSGAAISHTQPAETTITDTVVIKKPREVIVITNDSLQNIVVKGRAGDDDYVYKNSIHLVDSNYVSNTTIGHELRSFMPKVSVATIDSTSMGTGVEIAFKGGMGWVVPKTDAPGADFSSSDSYEIWFSPLTAHVYLNKTKHDFVTFGFGFDWRNYRMDSYTRFLKDDNGHVVVGDYPDGVKPKFSRVKVFSMTGTLLYEHHFRYGFGIGLGVVGNWNTYASIKTRYRLDNAKCKEVDKHIGQRRFTLDYMALIKNPILDFYVKYSPLSVLKDPSLSFHSVSFGFCF